VVPGHTNVLQFATDVAGAGAGSWINLLTNVPSTNQATFLDPAPTNAPRRFYRVVEKP
jgi:hypothetical protein